MGQYLLGSYTHIRMLYLDFQLEIRGKVKGCDLYVVSAPSTYRIENLAKVYGSPNRHLELEWGRFSGQKNEFIIPAGDLGK